MPKREQVVHTSLRTRLHSEKLEIPVIFGLTYSAQNGNVKPIVVDGIKEALWSDTFHPPATIGDEPYYNL
ncbi:MAG: hypothetical protein HUU55_23920 [Myxococcales bacterium]|nr:hypothetical protein [Myxococcales bacterium]